MIHVVATIQTAPGKRDAFLEEFARIVPLVLDEKGCISYGPTIDVETSLESQYRDAQEVVVIEQWESLPALEAHLVAPHMLEYRERVADLVEGATLRILEAPVG